MVPTVSQQLSAIRAALTKTVIPALPPEDRFAAEQAGLVVATLNWVLDVHESEYRCEVVENGDYRWLLLDLARLPVGPELETEINEVVKDEAPEPMGALREQTRRFKRLADRAATAAMSGPQADEARELLLDVARRQARREQAWFRMTGFPQAAEGDIASVLGS